MTPPLTPRLDLPLEPTSAAKTISSQLFGVLYITLTGLVDSVVPNSRPWSLLGQSLSYIIKLAPILWWALPASLTTHHPKPPNASTYYWLPETVPKAITVPYKLCSGKTITTAMTLPEAKENLSCPYLTQAKRSPVLVESSEEVAEAADAVFKNVSVLLPLQTFYKEFPGLRCMIKKWDKELAGAQDILVVLPPFGCITTCVEISIQKVKIKAVLDTRSLVNVVSLKLIKKLKLAPDLKYHQYYGKAGSP
ncbi:hypothetical protein DSO57_1028402 [Entomophthora muscae]|uniref:Uncharacterized protein n=1 Tax=Entomophthora muscae TaxID=34485 RepID=A0ACC2TD47_9FUNG|nr:hypothetical protein DSO57_1028402 [Entomophthora muscae]